MLEISSPSKAIVKVQGTEIGFIDFFGNSYYFKPNASLYPLEEEDLKILYEYIKNLNDKYNHKN